MELVIPKVFVQVMELVTQKYSEKKIRSGQSGRDMIKLRIEPLSEKLENFMKKAITYV